MIRLLPSRHCGPTRHGQVSRGVTLVELLVTITIVSMLASIIMFAMSQAQDRARANRTEAIVRKLDSIVTRHWETYQTRRIPLPVPSTSQGQAAAAFRLNCMRYMQMIDVPDRYVEIIVPNSIPPMTPPYLTSPMVDLAFNASPGFINPAFNTAAHQNYFLRCRDNYRSDTGATVPTLQHQAAECLYMIAVAVGGASATTLQNDLPWGDVDKDGMREVVDGWGRPISFIRWPAGFLTTGTQFLGERQTGDITNDHDPFDPLAVDSLAYRLHPLIFSAGPDGQDGIRTNTSDLSIPFWNYRANGSRTIAGVTGVLNPYATLPEGLIGAPTNAVDWRDNIHNHMQAYK